MNTPTAVPMMIFACFVVWGYCCMMFCQITVIVHRLITVRWGKILLQIAAGIVIVACSVLYNNRFNNGQMRAYVVLAMVCGALVYYTVCYGVLSVWAEKIIIAVKGQSNQDKDK